MVTQDELEPFAIVVPCFDEAARLQPEAFEDFAERHPSCAGAARQPPALQ